MVAKSIQNKIDRFYRAIEKANDRLLPWAECLELERVGYDDVTPLMRLVCWYGGEERKWSVSFRLGTGNRSDSRKAGTVLGWLERLADTGNVEVEKFRIETEVALERLAGR